MNGKVIVCCDECVPPEIKVEKGWKIIKVEGPIPFEVIGVLSSIAEPLKSATISIFAISTFNTDYILIKNEKLPQAKEVLLGSRFEFNL